MKRYLKADFERLSKRIPRWILIGLVAVIVIVVAIMTVTGSKEVLIGDEYNSIIKTIISFGATVFGLLEIIFVYGDDFKAKAMQKAIGTGITRRRIINTKLVETMILLAADLLMLVIISSIIGFILSPGFTFRHILSLLLFSFGYWMKLMAGVSVATIFAYINQGTGISVLVFLAIDMGLMTKVVDIIGSLLKIQRLHLSSYEISELSAVLTARLELFGINWPSLLGLLIYMAVSFAITTFLFEKKELDF